VGLKKGTRVSRAVKTAGLLGLVAVTASGCSKEQVLGFGWPHAVTTQGAEMRSLWTWSVIAALAVGVITWAAMFWTIIFDRKKGNDLPKQFQYNDKLEIGLTIVPLIVVCVLFYFTAKVEGDVDRHTAAADVTVDVTAFQWNWDFSYPTTKTAVAKNSTPDGTVHTIGTSSEIPILVLPVGKVIEYKLRSTDVIHSFYVPQFHFKRDVFPDPEKNNQDDTFQNTIDETGSFVGRCAELCGTYHSMMNFEVRAVTPAMFDQYVKLRAEINPATGALYTTSQALSKLDCSGVDASLCNPVANTTHPFTALALQQANG
jgi:cytochrome c oxidase subunit 2